MTVPETEIRQGIERFYAAVNRRDWDGAVAELHPDVEYAPIEEEAPCHGRAAMVEYFRRWFELWESEAADLEEITLSRSGDRSFVAWHFRARGRESGTPVDGRLFHVSRLCEGKLHRISEYQDRDEARAAFDAAP